MLKPKENLAMRTKSVSSAEGTKSQRQQEKEQQNSIMEKQQEEQQSQKVERRTFTAQEKCQAVLAIWSGSRTPGEICEEMGIAWAILSNWEERALSAMMEVFRPRRRAEEDRGPILSRRLMDLLEKKTQKLSGVAEVKDGSSRLESRLSSIEERIASSQS
jgi:hypothetical protein